jgi:hypothetical protein
MPLVTVQVGDDVELAAAVHRLASDVIEARTGRVVDTDTVLERLRVAQVIRRSIDEAIAAYALHARGLGFSTWTEMGEALGVTRQAVQKRFGSLVDADLVAVQCTGFTFAPGLSEARVYFRNGAPRPISKLDLYAVGASGSVRRTPIGTVDPGGQGVATVKVNLPLADGPPPGIIATFKDAAGVWWKHDENGALTSSCSKPKVAPRTPWDER